MDPAHIADIAEIHQESRRRDMVFHIHVEEQRREIEECVAEYGATPMALLNDRLDIDDRFTAIHCTHTDPVEMDRFLAPGATVPGMTDFTFTLDLSSPDVVAYLQQSLNAGKLRFMATSIHPAPVMGKGAQNYPDFFTKENKFAIPFGFAPELRLTVEISDGPAADLSGDGLVNGTDLATLLAQWGTDGAADLNNDGTVDGADLASLLAQWTG